MPTIAHGFERHYGKVVGNGHCVALLRECAGLPPTGEWRQGDPVRGSGAAPGTCIATFDPDGSYGNHVDGRSHAAILVADNANGLLVVDQWIGQPTHQRVVRFRNGAGDAVNDGNRYFVIELGNAG